MRLIKKTCVSFSDFLLKIAQGVGTFPEVMLSALDILSNFVWNFVFQLFLAIEGISQ